VPKGLGVAVGAGTLVGAGAGCLVGTAVGGAVVAVGCDTALAGVDVGGTTFSSDPDEQLNITTEVTRLNSSKNNNRFLYNL
tara:strand:- start:225 stop:467 length:243 start_codon:yes stop_codon:yes gene_type:complete